MDRYQQQWENLGTHDPYWAVLSDPMKKGGKWKKDDFFETGKQEIQQVIMSLSRMHVNLRLGTALDFGCGVGRLSRALSDHFEKVIGIDISRSMLEEAQVQNRDASNIEFLHNATGNLELIQSSTIDFVYSNIVLQHMPAGQQALFIAEFCRVLRTGGVAIFQTPSRHNLGTLTGWTHFLLGNRFLNIPRRIKYGRNCIMEIHTFTKEDVLAILDSHDMSIVEIEMNNATGRGFISYRYYAVKHGRAG